MIYLRMILLYPFPLVKELIMQKFDFFRPGHPVARMINGALLFFGGIGLVLYTLLGIAIYNWLR